MINILLLEDHSASGSQFKSLISTFFLDTGIELAQDRDAAIQMIRQQEYHLIILVLNLRRKDFLELVREIISFKPMSRILMMGTQSEQTSARTYLQAGAMGFLSKDASRSEIKRAINSILHNKRYMSASLLETYMHSIINERV